MPPVIGSPSLNATSIGVESRVRVAQAARLASLAGSSGGRDQAGHRPRSGQYDSSGNGAS